MSCYVEGKQLLVSFYRWGIFKGSHISKRPKEKLVGRPNSKAYLLPRGVVKGSEKPVNGENSIVQEWEERQSVRHRVQKWQDSADRGSLSLCEALGSTPHDTKSWYTLSGSQRQPCRLWSLSPLFWELQGWNSGCWAYDAKGFTYWQPNGGSVFDEAGTGCLLRTSTCSHFIWGQWEDLKEELVKKKSSLSFENVSAAFKRDETN